MAALVPPEWIAPAALGLVAAILTCPLFRGAAQAGDRAQSIDGLRGILAFGVFAHHFAITSQWQRLHLWERTDASVWNLMGEAAVVVFFMITGFLFFKKIRRAGGELDLLDFYAGRLLRIYPVYLFLTVVVLLLGWLLHRLAWTGFHSAARDAVRWLTFRPGDLFGFSNADAALAHVPWTLRYEALFYILLPLISFAWRAVAFRAALPVSLCLVALVLAHHPIGSSQGAYTTLLAAPFMLGGCAALAADHPRLCDVLRSFWGTALCVAAVTCVFTFFGSAYHPASYVLLAAAFLPIALGNTMAGLLVSRPLLVLGLVSYDTYLIHGFVLYVAFQVIWPTGLPVTGLASLTCMMAVFVPTLGLSLIVHWVIERPAMGLVRHPRLRHVSEWLARRRPTLDVAGSPGSQAEPSPAFRSTAARRAYDAGTADAL